MRWFRLLVCAAVMAAMTTVGVDGTSLSFGGKSAYAKKRHHKKRHHKKRARRKHRKHARDAAGEL